MQFLTVVAAALMSLTVATAQGATGKLGDAQVTTDNPAGVSYKAALLDKNTTGVRGTVTGTSSGNGTGVLFTVNFYGFPDISDGPFTYHIHDQPVPSDGNCTATLAHLDTYERGEDPPCDPAQPQTCQVGDMSGKYGKITSSGPYHASYLDLYTSTLQGVGVFFGNRSVVVHNKDKTRLNCGNFMLVEGTPSTPGGNSTGVATPTPTAPPDFTGSAALKSVSLGAVVIGMVAAVMF